MSSPATAPKEGKDKKGMGKVLYRMKTVFRKGEGLRKPRGDTAAAPASASGPVLTSPPPAAPVKKVPEYEGATKIPRIQIHEERARKLGAKFGLEIKPSEWHTTEGDVLRVDKPVRMRVHRECHRCKTQFGAGNQCPNCQHTRCKQCVRNPVRRTEAEKQANRERREALIQKHKAMAPIIPSYDYSQKIDLKRTGKAGGQDLVYKGRPRMRVRRHCHVCSSLISPAAKQARTCDKCGHRRCGDCPRNPDAKQKYPYGYPNDEPGPNSKGVHACHECKKKFLPNVVDGHECPNCSHKKCSECPRVKPRKVEPKPDPEVLESLRLRIADMKTSDS
ncbi:Uu.00g023020.m01.CDS01 [Anthostomella pinea]|uniref:Uu.00g023020.m01.CDS01 n=1 Tax=Anthostomella pinea TaxID=933095 RepID=A0AAI8W001_9PEZI|nr:Uu.00g023020.m01.CDS01 [Anthostomella pinea]